MKILHGIHHKQSPIKGQVIAIGNFDGVHCGHQKVISCVQQHAKRLSLSALVVIFEPQPGEYFLGDRGPARLTNVREKIKYLRLMGVERVLIMPFKQVVNLTAEQFVKRILIQQLNTQCLVVGDDFRFGSDRKGDVFSLRRDAKALHFDLEVVPAVSASDVGIQISDEHQQDKRISSTWIREALHSVQFELANALLGRAYSICGRVIHGNKQGRSLNFPTANIALHRRKSPLQGVFAVKVKNIDVRPIHGIANLGVRPTFGGLHEVLEVHLFDFNRDIYGTFVEVEFISKIRDEKKFISIEQLTEQIKKDVIDAKKIVHFKAL